MSTALGGSSETMRYQSGNYDCEVATTSAELHRHVASWEHLQARAVEDNFYLSPNALMSTLRHFNGDNRFYVVFVYDNRDPAERRLVGCAPFSLLPATIKTGTPVLSTFLGPHSYLSHPLLDREEPRSALRAIWDWVERPGQPWNLVRLRHMGEGSVTWGLIRDELRRRGRDHWVKSQFARAMLPRHDSFDAFLSTLPSSRRKTLRQRWRRLEKLGRVSVDVHRSLDSSPDLAERFMDLEAKSWKGDAGTALRNVPASRAFFTEITHSAGRERRLLFVEVKVKGRPVAMTTNFTVGSTMFAFKVAYDPAFRECSPGILAEIETVRAFHEEPGLVAADGGTAGSSHLDAYWQRLRQMNEVYTSTGHYRSELHLRAMAGLTRAKRALGEAFANLRASDPIAR